jgi:glycosyltransferase involved in cell wall biosynthesis
MPSPERTPFCDDLVAGWLKRAPARRISAMVRVRNEEQFLAASIGSIAPCVDEIVLVDNRSTDRTPSILRQLRRRFPEQAVLYHYPHPIRRVGVENWELAASSGSRPSPELSSSYYNWCLEKCTSPYVLKWDGDMVALDSLSRELEAWRRSDAQVLVFNGVNVHPNRRNLLAAKSTDRAELVRGLRIPRIPAWARSLTHDFPEPRLFPRFLARYRDDAGWTQNLASAFMRPRHQAHVRRARDPLFLHLKFCKHDPMANYSPDLGAVIASNVTLGPELNSEQRDALEGWKLG